MGWLLLPNTQCRDVAAGHVGVQEAEAVAQTRVKIVPAQERVVGQSRCLETCAQSLLGTRQQVFQ